MKKRPELLSFLNEGKLEAGCDEAGRGPLAGPVFAAAVILPPGFSHPLLDDSKKMSGKNRDMLRNIIEDEAVSFSVIAVCPEEIDAINILNASLLAMRKAYEHVAEKIHVDSLLVDGNKKPDVPVYVKAIVKGDAKIPEIMAASILAKTERDRIMKLCDAKWPEYGYAKHKGYPTEEHREAILKYGPSPIERMTFRVQKDETPSLF